METKRRLANKNPTLQRYRYLLSSLAKLKMEGFIIPTEEDIENEIIKRKKEMEITRAK